MDNAKKALFLTVGAAVAVCVVIFALLVRPAASPAPAPTVPRAPSQEPVVTTQTTGAVQGVTVDRNGRCHDKATGRFIKCPW